MLILAGTSAIGIFCQMHPPAFFFSLNWYWKFLQKTKILHIIAFSELPVKQAQFPLTAKELLSDHTLMPLSYWASDKHVFV